MSSTTTQSLRQSLRTLSTTWPTDKLRPAIQFSSALDKATDRILSSSTGQGQELTAVQQQKADKMVQSLQRLLANEAGKRYPLSSSTLQPPSFPKHYTRMKEAIDRAGRGEVVKGPSWRERFFVWR